jgi:hypothetical protein
MDQVCLALPVLPGRSDDARGFMHELESTRKAEYAASERRIGIQKEVWYLAHLPSGDHLIVYMESPDFGNALGLFSQSQNAFDQWFKQRLADATGVDLNNPPQGTGTELLSSYEA